MKRLFPVVAIGLLCGLIAMMIYSRMTELPTGGAAAESGPAARRAAAEAAETAGVAGTAGKAQTTTSSTTVLPAIASKETAERIEQLEKMEQTKRQKAEAAEKTQEARAKLQFYRSTAWRELIASHKVEFETLRTQAAQSPDKQVPCTICQAQGVLDLCVVCDHTGLCPTCKGVKVPGEVCPTCQGTGKCFLCSGQGKMPCPFCQALLGRKEIITPETPNPPAELPIN